MKKASCRGVITALVTPFYKGKVDLKSLENLVKFQLDAGVEGFVVNGTTAESPTLAPAEVRQIYKKVEAEVRRFEKKNKKKISLILGTGSNNTAETVEKTKLVKKLKADAALVVVPYYNKPPQEGLFGHFKTVAEKTKTAILLYNVPGRTVISMSAETVLRLSKIKNIIGIKEASGQIGVAEQIRVGAPSEFILLSGDDATAIDFILKSRGDGVISVISHVIPKEFRDSVDRARRQDGTVAEDYKRFQELNRLMGCEPNPIPVKMALYLMGVIRSPEMRLPLVPLTKQNTRALRSELEKLGILA